MRNSPRHGRSSHTHGNSDLRTTPVDRPLTARSRPGAGRPILPREKRKPADIFPCTPGPPLAYSKCGLATLPHRSSRADRSGCRGPWQDAWTHPEQVATEGQGGSAVTAMTSPGRTGRPIGPIKDGARAAARQDWSADLSEAPRPWPLGGQGDGFDRFPPLPTMQGRSALRNSTHILLRGETDQELGGRIHHLRPGDVAWSGPRSSQPSTVTRRSSPSSRRRGGPPSPYSSATCSPRCRYRRERPKVRHRRRNPCAAPRADGLPRNSPRRSPPTTLAVGRPAPLRAGTDAFVALTEGAPAESPSASQQGHEVATTDFHEGIFPCLSPTFFLR